MSIAPTLETACLYLMPVDEGQLAALLEVYTTNPFFIGLTEPDPANFTLEQLQGELNEAHATTGRNMLGIYRKVDNSLIGVADYLEYNPSDSQPWLGLLLIRGDIQGQGYGTEALAGLLHFFATELHWATVRLGVIAQNQPAIAFWTTHGFVPYRTVTHTWPIGEVEVICMERAL